MDKTARDAANKPSVPAMKIRLVPTYLDEEDPERTPERWWARRQNQNSNPS